MKELREFYKDSNEMYIKNLAGFIKDHEIWIVRILHLDYSFKLYDPKVTILDKYHLMIADGKDTEIYITLSFSSIYILSNDHKSELIIELR